MRSLVLDCSEGSASPRLLGGCLTYSLAMSLRQEGDQLPSTPKLPHIASRQLTGPPSRECRDAEGCCDRCQGANPWREC